MKHRNMIAMVLAFALPLAPAAFVQGGGKHEHKEKLISLGEKKAGPFSIKVGQFGKAKAGMKDLHLWIQATGGKIKEVEARVVTGDEQSPWTDADDLEGKIKFEAELEDLPKTINDKTMIEIKIEAEGDEQNHIASFPLAQ
ncbi:MAG TPA: hypothetical protein VGB55_06245 [Tepidisphaeraceae bacterium]|jgi:hypothetical protein